ncbi:hypothetical protein MHPYR_220059 [uncultured Mycobacterium sp.]|uniref:Uncharacterized protein n=1 Tax=uncultured Mycobacterium sp. TaxID=171292 RepID=A0A1Y5P9M2_9MYCO|nr:hypothetical protein MHPYR_220059 [uncultured Mycobacterium sp.]
MLDARNHYPQIKHHTPPPKWSNNTPLEPQSKNNGLVVSKPNSVSDDSRRRHPHRNSSLSCTRT